MHDALDIRRGAIVTHELRYAGDHAISLIDAGTRKKLGDRLMSMRLNFCGLAVDMLTERLRITGFTVDGKPDLDLWQTWQRTGMDAGAMQAHSLALSTGAAYVSVWAHAGAPLPMTEHPSQVIVRTHPLSREPVAALKRWIADGYAHSVLYEPDRISVYRSATKVPDGGLIVSTGWNFAGTVPNPLGVVPVVPLVNSQRLTEPYGTSEMEPIADLNDALVKVITDMMVTSESSARPRRWATGVEIEVSESGHAVDPWDGKTTTAQSESSETKFGQFSPADLAAYRNAAELLVRQIGALSGLPPQMLGLHADSAMSADAIRAAEASLTAKAEARQTMFGTAWSRVAALMVAIRDGRPVHTIRVEPIWADPSTRSQAQEADAVVKLHAAGLLTRSAALRRLGYSAADIAAMESDTAREVALRSLSEGGAA